MLKVKLTRDLRKNILRGHPWVYREAVQAPSRAKACLCQILDRKGQGLGWGIYSPDSVLALRVLSTEKKPPNPDFFVGKMNSALGLRQRLIGPSTNCYRLFNGEGDGLPGLVCDIYNTVAVIQFDGKSCFEFWDQDFIARWLLDNLSIASVYFKPRFSDSLEPRWWGEKRDEGGIEVKENDVRFVVDFISGQKTGFFLDQRDNRSYVQSLTKNLTTLNLFSYTGGFSMYAGTGGAKEVASVDIAPEAIKMANTQWELNGLPPEKHKGVCADVFEFIENCHEKWDVVIVDPPSMTHSEKNKARALASYSDLFGKAAQIVDRGGHLVLSSCSSHISFQDFFEIINQSLSQARRVGQTLRVSGQGVDHPFPHFCHELRYLKFVHLKLN